MTTNATAKPVITVLGSLNMDLVAGCRMLPGPGETLTCQRFAENFGGKGANQAVAAARAGGTVRMLGRVGEDAYAARLLQNLQANRVDVSHVLPTAATASGLALIVVNDAGENQIVVVPGANGQVTAEDVQRAETCIQQSDCLVVQLEVPLPAVVRGIELARQHGVRVILDPAPVPTDPLPDAVFQVDLICPNQSETQRLTGVADQSPKSMRQAVGILHRRGAKVVAVTLGPQGTLLSDDCEPVMIESITIDAVDTTAAGDAFAGALAVRWAETDNLSAAIRWANLAGALAASGHGAQTAIAQRTEIQRRWEDFRS